MEFQALMEARQSVNFFDPTKPVTDEELRKMVELATLIPSSFNLQPWNLIENDLGPGAQLGTEIHEPIRTMNQWPARSANHLRARRREPAGR